MAALISGCNLPGPDSLGIAVESEDQDISSMSTTSQNGGSEITTGPAFSEESFFELRNQQDNQGVLGDINVRKAIFHAIDRKRITVELLGGYGEVQESIFNPDTEYYYPAWQEYDYDPEKAMEYLKRAGYSTENPLYLTIGTNADSQSRQKIEDIIVENLDSIGIKLWVSNEEPVDWFVDYLKTGNYELGIWAISTPDFLTLNSYFGSNKIPSLESDENKNCNNYYWYNDKDFELELEKILDESVPDAKKQLSDELQDQLSENAFFLPLYSRLFAVAYNKKIKNIDINTLSGSFFKNISEVDVDIPDSELQSQQSESIADSGNEFGESSGQVKYIKSLVIGYQNEPYCFNPLIPDNAERDNINELIVKGLWEKKEFGQYEPFLAESVSAGEVNNNETDGIKMGLKAVVKLKDNIFWQDGSLVTSIDVVETILAAKNSSTVHGYDGVSYGIIKSIDVIDNKQFIVVFNEYSYNWKSLFSVIFPAKLLEDANIEDLFYEDVFGCGPFNLKEWVMGEYILLERNSFFSGKKPNIDAIKIIFNSDINYLLGMLKEGEIDVLSLPVDIDLLKEIEEGDSLNLMVKPGNLIEHLAICLKPENNSQ